MLKVIAQKIQTHSRYYQIIFDNTSIEKQGCTYLEIAWPYGKKPFDKTFCPES